MQTARDSLEWALSNEGYTGFIVEADSFNYGECVGLLDLDTGKLIDEEVFWANITTGQYAVFEKTPEGFVEIGLRRGRLGLLSHPHSAGIQYVTTDNNGFIQSDVYKG